METCDVLIVGGGPAGSTCARLLTQAGFDVLLLDKATFPRDKVCAGWITPAVVSELELDLEDYRKARILQPISGFRTSILAGPEVVTRYPSTVSYGIRRCEFDHYLLSRCGARLKLGTPLKSLHRDGEMWIVNDEISAPLLIGAGGHFCPVARQTTETTAGAEAVVLAQEIEFEMTPEQRSSCAFEPEVPELFFCPDLKGYAWVFRKGDYLNVGLGREGETRLSSHVEEFCQWLRRSGRVGWDLASRFHGHAYRLYLGARQKLQFDRLVLIGDSAGLAYPQSGEGIRPAIESGLLAAETICETAPQNYADIGTRLEAKLRRRFGPPSPHKPGAGGLIPSSWKQFAARRLLATNWFTRRVLIDRWFLHTQLPPLTGLAHTGPARAATSASA